MKLKQIIPFIFLMLIFSSTTFAQVADKDLKIQSVEDDKFSSSVTINGVLVDAKHKFFDVEKENWSIRSFVNKKSGAAVHQLYVNFIYFGDWNWFDYAADEDAKTLAVNRIGSEVVSCGAGDCMMIETVGIALDEAVLRLKMQTGYEIKVSAKSGQSHIIKVTSEQIRAQMLALANFVAPAGVMTNGELAKLVASIPPPPASSKIVFGIKAFNLPPNAAVAMNHEGLKGALIIDVTKGSVADKAGLILADTVFEYDGKPVSGSNDLQKLVAATELGKKVSIKLLRGIDVKELTLEAQF